ncbi:hypothetical protein [Neorhizobium sp. NCHU2750]|uniref:hypothetical protein n=1 Tax=Neorhizobium sp. NCHU2750 TaxID=1825976 RepID=UPI000EB64730|nr:hypothetical protein NCHU2750_33450 [Neorhizobium sp. NCHU2750]
MPDLFTLDSWDRSGPGEADGESAMGTYHDRQQASAKAVIDILPPEEARGKVLHFRRPVDVVDAEFETVRDRSSQYRAPQDGTVHAFRSRQRAEVSAVAARKPASAGLASGLGSGLAGLIETKLLKMPADMFIATVAVAVVAVFMLFGGFSLIPGTKPVPPAQPIDITHVTMTPQDANGMRVLLINGIVENRTHGKLAMPVIRADLVSGNTVVATTLISTAAAQIGGGQSYGFSARVPHPGGKLPDLRLSLVPRGA